MMKNRKAQGFDTFKLLIAAVVAMVILGIVTGVFGKIWSMIAGIQCLSNPINEFGTTIQEAQTGLRATTEDICLASGAGLEAEDIAKTLSSIGPEDITFHCGKEGGQPAAVCEEGGPLDLSEKVLDATGDATFRAIIDCDESSGNYECNIYIVNA